MSGDGATSSQSLLLVAEVARVAACRVGALTRVWRESGRGVLRSWPSIRTTTQGRLTPHSKAAWR